MKKLFFTFALICVCCLLSACSSDSKISSNMDLSKQYLATVETNEDEDLTDNIEEEGLDETSPIEEDKDNKTLFNETVEALKAQYAEIDDLKQEIIELEAQLEIFEGTEEDKATLESTIKSKKSALKELEIALHASLKEVFFNYVCEEKKHDEVKADKEELKAQITDLKQQIHELIISLENEELTEEEIASIKEQIISLKEQLKTLKPDQGNHGFNDKGHKGFDGKGNHGFNDKGHKGCDGKGNHGFNDKGHKDFEENNQEPLEPEEEPTTPDSTEQSSAETTIFFKRFTR